MTLAQRYEGILGYFSGNVPVAESELDYENAFQLLVAVMLSAQCTDKRVNMVTPELFRCYPDARSLSEADVGDVFSLVKSVTYPKSKSEHLVGMAKMLVENYGCEVPSEVSELVKMPGVGRKTANVVSSIIYNQPVIAVDTHVFRVSRRLGLSRGKNPLAVEADLERHVPESLRPVCHHWLLLHGRYVCTARNPKCTQCPLAQWCKAESDTRKSRCGIRK